MMGLRGEAAGRQERIKEDCVKGLRMQRGLRGPAHPADHMPSKITGLYFLPYGSLALTLKYGTSSVTERMYGRSG